MAEADSRSGNEKSVSKSKTSEGRRRRGRKAERSSRRESERGKDESLSRGRERERERRKKSRSASTRSRSRSSRTSRTRSSASSGRRGSSSSPSRTGDSRGEGSGSGSGSGSGRSRSSRRRRRVDLDPPPFESIASDERRRSRSSRRSRSGRRSGRRRSETSRNRRIGGSRRRATSARAERSATSRPAKSDSAHWNSQKLTRPNVEEGVRQPAVASATASAQAAGRAGDLVPGEGRQLVQETDATVDRVPWKLTTSLVVQVVVCTLATVSLLVPFIMGLKGDPFYGFAGQWIPMIHGLIVVGLSLFLAAASRLKCHVGKSKADGRTIVRPCWRTLTTHVVLACLVLLLSNVVFEIYYSLLLLRQPATDVKPEFAWIIGGALFGLLVIVDLCLFIRLVGRHYE